jgi:hypothetical protein
VTSSISSLCAADFDRDLDPDLAVFGTHPVLFENDGTGIFSDASGAAPGFGRFRAGAARGGHQRRRRHRPGRRASFARSRIYSNTRSQLAWRDLPQVGRRLDLDLCGAPGAEFSVYASTATTHVPFGPAGVLRLDRSRMFFRSAGVLDAEGRGSASYAVPDEPALIGRSLYWQALFVHPRRLTNLEITTFSGL